MSYDATVRFRRLFRGVPRIVDGVGEQALFYGESMRYIPNALTRYRKETIRLVAEMTMGAGALVMIGGTVGVAAFLTLASGGVIAVQGYSSLGNIGIEALTGFLSAFLNVRIVAPVIDTEVDFASIDAALKRMESRDVFGKIILRVG